MSTCECSTHKKAWRNPLAPMAKCKMAAKVLMLPPPDIRREPVKACRRHATKMLTWGWTESPLPAPGPERSKT